MIAEVVGRGVEDVDCSKHLVQTVLVVVSSTVDVEVRISMLVVLPVVWVKVTGQRVVVVSTTTVVMTSVTLYDEVVELELEAAGEVVE